MAGDRVTISLASYAALPACVVRLPAADACRKGFTVLLDGRAAQEAEVKNAAAKRVRVVI